MSKFSGAAAKPAPRVAIRTVSTESDTVTHEGGAGYSRDAKSELFLLAVTNFVSEDTFYEDGKTRDARYASLLEQVTREDPSWVAAFLPYLRDKMFMRSAAVVGVAEYIRAGGPNGRKVVADTLMRADEPAELLGYWLKVHGRSLPKPLKRGLADAVERLYNERNALKYDSSRNSIRMGDVIDLVHPTPKAPWQGDLFKWLLDTRHNRENISVSGTALGMISMRGVVEDVAVEGRREFLRSNREALAQAGMTWESLSGWLQGPMDAEAWEAMIPEMGYMALLRNLRNFDDAGISEDARKAVILKLTHPDEIAKSRQFPFRFYSAFKELATLHWGEALEKALNQSLTNVPALPGTTLVLVDVSGSMRGGSVAGKRSKLTRDEAAALFGAVVAIRAEKATLIAYDDRSMQVYVRDNASVLKTAEAFRVRPGTGGTQTFQALRDHYKGHDRVIIITDEQAHYDASGASGITAPIYTFNVAGYKAGHLPVTNKRYTFGGLNDAAFSAITMLEKAGAADWAFLGEAA